MQAEVLTHLPHAESPRCIGCPNRVIPLRVLLRVPSHRPGAARPLAARHFTQVLAWLDLGNGSVNKGLRVDQCQRNLCTEQDLTPLLLAHELPNAPLRGSFGVEPFVVPPQKERRKNCPCLK